jgi:hypothetical protein
MAFSFEFKKNDLVKIADDISLTDEYYTITYEMKRMIGKTYLVGEIVDYDKIRVNGFNWHPKDLIPLDDVPVPIQEIVLFDPNNLEV